MNSASFPGDHEDRKRPVSTTKGDGFVNGGGGMIDLPPPPALTPQQERKLWRKVDRRLIPILTVMYLFSFLDRGNIGNAKLQGITTELHLSSQQFNIAVTMYFIPYCILEFPTNIALKRFRPSRWLPGLTILWGIFMTLMGLVKTYPQLVGVRIMLGVAEAGLFPGITYYLTLWYPRYHLQSRIALIGGAASLAGAFSGLLAYAIHFMSGKAGLLGWSWIFILEGIATVVVGLAAWFVMVDFAETAHFLTPEERSFLVHKKKYDYSSVGEEEAFSSRHFWEAFTDWQIWAHILVDMSLVAPLYGITFYLPTIINSFGYSPAVSQLLTVPPYVVATITALTIAHYSDKTQRRSPFILLGLTLISIGLSINISDASHGVKYFGIFFIVSGAYGTFPGDIAWLGNNLAGQYKRGIGMALHNGLANFAGAIAANIYRAQDAPRFILGHGLEFMFVGIGFITTPILILAYTRINKKRDATERHAFESGQTNKYTKKQLTEMGDRAPDFRYTL